MSDFENLLSAAINDYEQKGRENKSFLEKAHRIYNSYAINACPLKDTEHPYLLGIVFATFAKYYINDVNIYASILENACYCFSKVMTDSSSISERQCAAIRLLLCIEDNYPLMLQVAKKLKDYKCQELYGQSAMELNIFSQGMDQYTYEEDILRNIGSYCIATQKTTNINASISVQDMNLFQKLTTSKKYNLEWPLVCVSSSQVFKLFYELLYKIISTPCKRRTTVLPWS